MPPPGSPTYEGAPDVFRFRSSDRSPIQLSAREDFPRPIPLRVSRGLELHLRSAEEGPPAFSLSFVLHNRRAGAAAFLRSPLLLPARDGPVLKARFDWPSARALDRFDQITIELIPNGDRIYRAPRVAVLGFRLY